MVISIKTLITEQSCTVGRTWGRTSYSWVRLIYCAKCLSGGGVSIISVPQGIQPASSCHPLQIWSWEQTMQVFFFRSSAFVDSTFIPFRSQFADDLIHYSRINVCNARRVHTSNDIWHRTLAEDCNLNAAGIWKPKNAAAERWWWWHDEVGGCIVWRVDEGSRKK